MERPKKHVRCESPLLMEESEFREKVYAPKLFHVQYTPTKIYFKIYSPYQIYLDPLITQYKYKY